MLTKQYSQKHDINIYYNTLEPFPLKKEEYLGLNFPHLLDSKKNEFKKLHESQWEREEEISSSFVLLKNNISIQRFKPNKKYDIVYFDGFSPDKQPEIWTYKILQKIYTLLNTNGFLTTYCAKGNIKRKLKKIGFKVFTLEGPPGKREMIRANKI